MKSIRTLYGSIVINASVSKSATEGGFAAAARALDISPAVVTRLAAHLGEHVGTRLLVRRTRRLSFSVESEAYLARVKAIL